MKAIRIHSYGGSEQLKLEEMPQPGIRDDQVLVRVYAAGVNPVDWKIREGYLKDFLPKAFPFTAGQDLSGEVVAAGQGVRNFHVGDAVFGFAYGSYAEYAAARADEIALKPTSVDFLVAAAIPTAALTAWQAAIGIARVSAGQRVLIHGAAGGVGSFAVQLAKWKGAVVVATASGNDIGYLKDLGVEQMIDYKAERFEEKVQGADAVIDLVGHETLARSYQVVKAGGVLVTTVGPLNEFEAQRRGIRAVSMVMKRDSVELAQIASLVDQGILKPRVDRVLPISDAKEAQDLNQAGQSHGKIVLRVA